jgi:phosphoglycerate dehydrogenase-like enzyme
VLNRPETVYQTPADRPSPQSPGVLQARFGPISGLLPYPRPMSDELTPVGVACPPDGAADLLRLARDGELPCPVRAVVFSPEGRLEEGDPRGTKVLWRTGRFPNSWVLAAIDQLPDLAWYHSDYVGLDGILERLAPRGVMVTNGLGNYSRPMAEWVVLAMLSWAKRFPDYVRRSDAGVWADTDVLSELDGSVALLLGLGSVNSLVAAMLEPFGVDVVALVNRPRPELPQGVRRIVGPETWRRELSRADFVVVGLPLTPATTRMIDAAALAAMKETAMLVNPARGAVIDEAALVEALDRGEIGGAVLDAFIEEPLPPGHPLWRRPNVIVVPHHTWSSSKVQARILGLFVDELDRFVHGRPLRNRVDPGVGY